MDKTANRHEASRVSFGRDELNFNARSEALVKFENNNFFTVQLDGNVCYYTPKECVWASHSNVGNGDGSKLLFRFQDDGNMVLYYNNEPVWATETFDKGMKFVIEDSWPYLTILNKDGNIVWYAKDAKQ